MVKMEIVSKKRQFFELMTKKVIDFLNRNFFLKIDIFRMKYEICLTGSTTSRFQTRLTPLLDIVQCAVLFVYT